MLIEQAKVVIYVLSHVLVKSNPQFYSKKVLEVLDKNQEEISQILKELDEDISIEDFIVNIFEKERLH